MGTLQPYQMRTIDDAALLWYHIGNKLLVLYAEMRAKMDQDSVAVASTSCYT